MAEKRRNRKQRKLDKSQDKRLKELERRLDDQEREGGGGDDNRDEQSKKERTRGGERKDDQVRGSLEQGGPMVKREYDRQFASMGSRFAEGDCTFSFSLLLLPSLLYLSFAYISPLLIMRC